jgi:hypothetical protein
METSGQLHFLPVSSPQAANGQRDFDDYEFYDTNTMEFKNFQPTL